MEVIDQLRKFHEVIVSDPRMGLSHVSIYLTLILKWNGDARTPFEIRRVDVMEDSKILSRETYNRCMKDLRQFGYIQYIPSTSPFNPSLIYIKKL